MPIMGHGFGPGGSFRRDGCRREKSLERKASVARHVRDKKIQEFSIDDGKEMGGLRRLLAMEIIEGIMSIYRGR